MPDRSPLKLQREDIERLNDADAGEHTDQQRLLIVKEVLLQIYEHLRQRDSTFLELSEKIQAVEGALEAVDRKLNPVLDAVGKITAWVELYDKTDPELERAKRNKQNDILWSLYQTDLQVRARDERRRVRRQKKVDLQHAETQYALALARATSKRNYKIAQRVFISIGVIIMAGFSASLSNVLQHPGDLQAPTYLKWFAIGLVGMLFATTVITARLTPVELPQAPAMPGKVSASGELLNPGITPDEEDEDEEEEEAAPPADDG